MIEVTCGLTACTPGSASVPKLGNEYGEAFTFLNLIMYVFSATTFVVK